MDLLILAQTATNDLATVGYTVLWVALGVLMLAIGHKVADWITPGALWEEIARGNMAVALTSVGVLVGESFVIAAVIGGTGASHDAGIFAILGNQQLNLMLNSIIWGLGSVLLMWVIFKIFDLMTPIKFNEQLAKGNVALGAVLCGLFTAWGIIISGVLGS